jgi:hypothetical protein
VGEHAVHDEVPRQPTAPYADDRRGGRALDGRAARPSAPIAIAHAASTEVASLVRVWRSQSTANVTLHTVAVSASAGITRHDLAGGISGIEGCVRRRPAVPSPAPNRLHSTR